MNDDKNKWLRRSIIFKNFINSLLVNFLFLFVGSICTILILDDFGYLCIT